MLPQSFTQMNMKIEVKTLKEWFETLKRHWDVSETELRERDNCLIILKFNVNSNMIVGFFDKETRSGYVFENNGRLK